MRAPVTLLEHYFEGSLSTRRDKTSIPHLCSANGACSPNEVNDHLEALLRLTPLVVPVDLPHLAPTQASEFENFHVTFHLALRCYPKKMVHILNLSMNCY
jgi:hypothetical protein